ncbi:MAG: hypothetical protein LC637_13725, partial [Xanthomonadaceae bacterium]|nr:hypothetical protein [Xanthomonadaceae bacterium]
MSADLDGARPDGLEPLIDAIGQRVGPALRSVVLYGSTRRSNNPGDGLVDLMAVVSSYRAVHGIGASLLNTLLPPNVYYLETGSDQARLRCKYIIVSEKTLRARTRGGLDGYFWARFTQPCRRVWAADQAAELLLAECRAQAAAHFARSAARLGSGVMTDQQFWVRALRATYG